MRLATEARVTRPRKFGRGNNKTTQGGAARLCPSKFAQNYSTMKTQAVAFVLATSISMGELTVSVFLFLFFLSEGPDLTRVPGLSSSVLYQKTCAIGLVLREFPFLSISK